MAAIDLLNNLFHIRCNKLSKKEKHLLETALFVCLYQELRTTYEVPNEKGDVIMNNSIIRNLVNELLTSNDYSVQGLANYTGYPIEVISDLAAGINANPTFSLATKIIELHAIARREFYSDLIKKIFKKFDD